MSKILTDAKPGPLAPRAKKAPAVEVLLVDGDLAPLHADVKLPRLPASFRGVVGDRADLAEGARRLIAVGCGRPSDHEQEARFWEAAGAAALDALRALRIDTAALVAPPLPKSVDVQAATNQIALGATLASYRCTAFRSQPPKGHFEVKALQLAAAQWQGTERARQLGDAVNWARALVDAPPNLMTPQGFADAAKELVASGVRVQVLDQKALEKLGANGLLAVGRSSEHPPCMLVCEWSGRREKQVDLGLVGKGLTFDGGGLNLKSTAAIANMKLDMAGAAAVVGAMRVLAQRKAPLNVVAVMPLCENVIDGKGYRPGDVITSLSGLTIEVDNTDAEGRVVLADAISYLIREYRPQRMIDLATLTGAILTALLEEYAGLFTADDALAAELHAASAACGEGLWRMPLTRRQDYIVDSEIADVRNTGNSGLRGAGTSSAIAGAKFLERFAAGTPWAHLDMAGVAMVSRPIIGIPKGATGYGVRLLDAFAERMETN
ncbi:leucyl aminopeptidase family protein [Solimonas sp. K1W22B-7]|uniref:leucyl aminopeptidase family protein n=1 Tax=Solimonas sp. K1W22B-7 TaxID=2303331 RepID=UPI000E336590|nr:M17 family peptidase N-terminal domain-containing protein [Solimonas sp. K1W22B-7]AXQ30024.1 leucyl aminopeptidase family protein [Solimonas sp. K1W22B-7]